jgi:hypothetical protein
MIDLKKIIKENFSLIALFSILFLFFIQTLSDLVERIYAFALLNLEPDENILGLLFLLSPLVLLFFRKKFPNIALLVVGEIMIVSRLIEPLVKGPWIYIFAGLTVASFIIFFPAFITKIKGEEKDIGLRLAIGLTIAVTLSILFRTVNATVDISQYRWGQIIGWILGIIATLKLLGMKKSHSLLEKKR